MNQKETIAVLAVLKTAYPQFYRGLSPQELQETVTLWSEMFAAEDFQVVKAAVKAHIATDTKGYPAAHRRPSKEAIPKDHPAGRDVRGGRHGAMWHLPCATADTTAWPSLTNCPR